MNIIRIIIVFVLLLDTITIKEWKFTFHWLSIINDLSGFRISSDLFRQFRTNKIVKLDSFFQHLIQYLRSFFSLIGFADHYLVTLGNVTFKCLSPNLVVAYSKQMPPVIEIPYSKLTSSEHPNIKKYCRLGDHLL